MFKRLENAWNARTPKFLHNRTKENIIFQLVLTVLLVFGMIAKDEWKHRQEMKYLHATDPEGIR